MPPKKSKKSVQSKEVATPISPKNIHFTVTSDPVVSPVFEKAEVEEDSLEGIENTIVSKEEPKIEEPKIEEEADTKSHKKRGRKPKGGKLILKQTETVAKTQTIANIVLHLKCSLADVEDANPTLIVRDPLKYNPVVPPEIMSANCFQQNELKPSLVDEAIESKKFAYFQEPLISSVATESNNTDRSDTQMAEPAFSRSLCQETNSEKVTIKEINAKLKKLKINLYKNECSDKRAACFWCTYDFDSPPCYIPKYEMNQTIYGYGSFCRPECAAAYLMKENLDDSCKFERYYLLNQMYGKIFGYEKNIKLAPNPYYLLDKYYGNLTIQEYRKLLKLDHMLVVLEKPMTRVLPELHEDNDTVNINTNVVNVNGNYKVKRQSEKQAGPTKTSIIRDCFNL